MVSWEGLTLTAGAILIAVDLPYRSAELADGAWALLAYPKLYGAAPVGPRAPKLS